ncbi:MAG: hypothetical protein ABGZ23_30280 [Fuerstiella sp.]|nr:hypothetical protein [Fuerstiella sp.]
MLRRQEVIHKGRPRKVRALEQNLQRIAHVTAEAQIIHTTTAAYSARNADPPCEVDNDVDETALQATITLRGGKSPLWCHTGSDDQINNPVSCAKGSFVRCSGYLSNHLSRRKAFCLG